MSQRYGAFFDRLAGLFGAQTFVAPLALLVLLSVPLWADDTMLNLLANMLIWGLFAMGYDFMFGYAGVVSFGHAAFFGLGAYMVALPLVHLQFQGFWLLLVLAILVPMLFGLLVSVVSIRAKGVYFAILTLAWQQILYIVFENFTEVTGGTDGLPINVPDITIIPGVMSVSPYDPGVLYFLVLGCTVVSFVVLYRLSQSPMGEVLRGIRENINRMEYIGFKERQYRIGAFIVSCGVSGLAGGLIAIATSFVGLGFMDFVINGEVIVWTIIGGQGTLIGPVVGGAVIYLLQDLFSNRYSWWLIPVGILFIAMVIFMPEGIAGRAKMLINRARSDGEETD